MAELFNWDKTAANNNDAPPDGAPEGIAPEDVNDIMREIMAVLARHYEVAHGVLTTSGTSTAYVLTPTGGVDIAAGRMFAFRTHEVSGAEPTLNVKSTGAKPLKYADGSRLGAQDLRSGATYLVAVSSDLADYYVIGGNTWSPNEIRDVVGGMFSGNTETRVRASYQSSDGTIDLLGDIQVAGDGLTKVTVSDTAPALSDMIDGELWLKY